MESKFLITPDYHRKATLLFIAVLSLAALAAGLSYLHSAARYTTYRIQTQDSVSGLIVNSPVELHGVEVGTVAKIELNDARTVDILLRVARDAPVSKATVATITARGLAARGFTGYVYVALEDSGPDSGPLTIQSGQPFPVIPTAPSRTDTMDTTVADAVQQVRALTQLLQSALDEKTVAALKRSVDAFQTIMGTLARNNARLGSLIVNTERDSRAIGLLLDGKTITSLKQSLNGLQQVAAALAANDAELRSLIVNAERDSREIRPVLETSHTTLKELHTEALPQLYKSLDSLEGLTRSLGELADRLARDPSTVIRGTVIRPGPGER